MCGIFGSIRFNHNNLCFISKLSKSLNHRGPDNFGNFYDKENDVFLAHARLSVIDLTSDASQPMIDSESGNVITFNGEIYNYLEIRKELELLKISFKSNSDTEVILKGYLIWGKNILQKLSGMFSFCIYDNINKHLFLARDRMGEKPLYYYNNDKKFIFSSELSQILIEPEISKDINQNEFFKYMQHGYTSTSHSILSSIKKLPPAFFMIVNFEGRQYSEEYWKLSHFFNNKIQYKSTNEVRERLDFLLQKSIYGQLVSDVPLGAFLSGGVDSSIIAASAKLKNSNLSTFSAGFSDPRYDERDQAKKVSITLGTDHHEFELGEVSFNNILDVYSKFDEPFADTSSLPTYYLSKLTKKYATVALSGDGGDELFCGYQTYLADTLYKVTSKIPRGIFRNLSYVVNKLPASSGKVDFNYKIKSFLNQANSNFETAHISWRQIFSKEDAYKLLKFSSDTKIEEYPEFSDQIYWKDVNNCHYLDQAMYVDLKTWLVNDILYKVDRMSMANSLEVRAPFLDHNLVEFAASLNINYKMKGLASKFILKDLLLRKYNLDLRNLPKLGFNAPMSHWIRIHHKNFLEYLVESNLFNKRILEQLINDHLNNIFDNSYKIIALLGYASWSAKLQKM